MSLFIVRHQHAADGCPTQDPPERAEWNRLGYGNNAIQDVPIRVS